jgi:hypothetical protein
LLAKKTTLCSGEPQAHSSIQEVLSSFTDREPQPTRLGRSETDLRAGFVWIYSGLYWLCDEGKDIALAQIIFIFVYLATQE